MKFVSKRIVLAGLFLLIGAFVWAYAPLVVFVGSTELTAGSNLAEAVTPEISAAVDLDWRVPAGQSGYAALWGTARLETAPLTGFPLADRETLGFEIGGFLGGIDLTASSSITASSGLLDSAAQVEPVWRVTGLVPVGQSSLNLGGEYSGTYRWRESDTIDRVENRLTFRTVLEPSFTSAYQGDLTGGLDYFPATYLSDLAGTPTAEQRRDFVLLAKFSMDILSDYFTRWTAEASSGARFSNANRYLSATGTLETGSENRVFGSVTGNLSLSPARSLGIDLSLAADTAQYLSRAAINEAGEPLPTSLAYLRSVAGITVDWSPNGRFFLLGTISAVGSVANDPLYAGWSATAGISAEWRL